jgi:hypothetical protein
MKAHTVSLTEAIVGDCVPSGENEKLSFAKNAMSGRSEIFAWRFELTKTL